MNRRTVAILALLAGLFAVLAFIGQSRDESGSIAGESAGTLLLPDLARNLESMQQILISAAGAETLVSLDRTGEEWIVAEEDGYRAAVSQINALLIALAEARIVEEKTRNPDFYSRLGVAAIDGDDARGLKVALQTAAGGRYEVILGDAYGSGERYARIAGEALSVLIDRDPELPRNSTEWVEADILAIPRTRVQRVEIRHPADERLVIYKETPEDSSFTVDAVPEGRELQYPGVADVTGSVLQELQLEAVDRQPAVVTDSSVIAEFRTFDGLVVTATATADEAGDPWLSFNARFDAEQALAFASEPADDATNPASASESSALTEATAINSRLSGWRYRIPSYQFSQMTRRMEDLLRAPPVNDE